MQQARNTRLFAMQFIKMCFRGSLRECWLEMLINISDKALTCLYQCASALPSHPPVHCCWREKKLSPAAKQWLLHHAEVYGGGRRKEAMYRIRFWTCSCFVWRKSDLSSVGSNDAPMLPHPTAPASGWKLPLFFPFCFRLL